MKKFISMVMAAAMVVSLVPATAFAAEATLKVVGDNEWTEQEADGLKDGDKDLVINGAQLQLKVKDLDTKIDVKDDYEIKLHFDNAEFAGAETLDKVDQTADSTDVFVIKVYDQDSNKTYYATDVSYSFANEDDDVTITFWENGSYDIDEDDIVYININGDAVEYEKPYLYMTTYKVGAEATVKVTGDLGDTEAKTIASVVEAGIAVDVDDTVDVAEEEIVKLEDVTIEVNGGDNFGEVLDYKYKLVGTEWELAEKGDTDLYAKIVLKLSNGFEFEDETIKLTVGDQKDVSLPTNNNKVVVEDDELTLYTKIANADEFTLSGIVISAEDAKVGDVATIKVSTPGVDSVSVDVANVVAEGLFISVDEDEDVPVMWSGVDADNTGLTVDDTHESLVITLEESVKGSYDDGDEVEFVLPEGVYVVDIDAPGEIGKSGATLDSILRAAYKEGDNESFVIEKRVIGETTEKAKAIDTDFTLTLIADATFVGPVDLTMLVDGEEVNTVTIAEFKAPFAVAAQQNDLKIDYRNTEVPTDVVITEAEAGLWDKGLVFTMALDHEIEFEGDPEVTVNEDDSDMEVDVDVTKGVIEVMVKTESDDEAGVITMSGLELYMDRNLAAGAYDLEMGHNAAVDFYLSQLATTDTSDVKLPTNVEAYEGFKGEEFKTFANTTVADVKGYLDRNDVLDVPNLVVKEGFVNIVTAGREQDDASFTTKVVVPVGESYMVAGEQTIALEVPAYVTDAGRTMLPVRAVATALGINNNNVLWDQATKTVTILYGQRIITMQVGSSVINVNGSAIPASAAVEVVNGRTFLGFRDLATALGVTDIVWDQATRTVTLNGNI